MGGLQWAKKILLDKMILKINRKHKKKIKIKNRNRNSSKIRIKILRI